MLFFLATSLLVCELRCVYLEGFVAYKCAHNAIISGRASEPVLFHSRHNVRQHVFANQNERGNWEKIWISVLKPISRQSQRTSQCRSTGPRGDRSISYTLVTLQAPFSTGSSKVRKRLRCCSAEYQPIYCMWLIGTPSFPHWGFSPQAPHDHLLSPK